jgi:hypothetical protein
MGYTRQTTGRFLTASATLRFSSLPSRTVASDPENQALRGLLVIGIAFAATMFEVWRQILYGDRRQKNLEGGTTCRECRF